MWTSVLTLALLPQRHRADAWLEHQEPFIHMAQNKREKKQKERREQPNQKINPPMITSAENYPKKKKQQQQKTHRQNPRTNGKSKAIQTKSHREAYRHTLEKEKKGKIYVYRCSQSPPPQFGMIRCLFRYSTDSGYIRLIVEV